MQIGQVIRKYRKMKNMTQEEMAKRLGVTAPAVNKWENNASFPDITLLAPIARLLDISLDTLLSFREELTAEEIKAIVYEADSKLKEQSYDKMFQWAKGKLTQYPNCEQLIWQMAVILDAQRFVQKIPNSEKYDDYICSCYVRALDSTDENIRNGAADSLFEFYMRNEQYEKAETYLEYFSKQNPERKRKQAALYSKTNRISEAYKAYEELLFSTYQMANAALYGMFMLAMNEKDMKRAHMLVEKLSDLSECFDMGEYYEASCRLELATLEKDVETTITTMQKMLSGADSIVSYCKSSLYEHMSFKEVGNSFTSELKNNLLKCFLDEESYGFLKDDKRWQELAKQYKE